MGADVSVIDCLPLYYIGGFSYFATIITRNACTHTRIHPTTFFLFLLSSPLSGGWVWWWWWVGTGYLIHCIAWLYIAWYLPYISEYLYIYSMTIVYPRDIVIVLCKVMYKTYIFTTESTIPKSMIFGNVLLFFGISQLFKCRLCIATLNFKHVFRSLCCFLPVFTLSCFHCVYIANLARNRQSFLTFQ